MLFWNLSFYRAMGSNFWFCKSPEGKGPMCMCQTLIVGLLWSQLRIFGKNSLWEGCGWRSEPYEGRAALFWNKYPCSDSWRKAQQASARMRLRSRHGLLTKGQPSKGGSRPQKTPKPSYSFPERSGRMKCPWQLICVKSEKLNSRLKPVCKKVALWSLGSILSGAWASHQLDQHWSQDLWSFFSSFLPFFLSLSLCLMPLSFLWPYPLCKMNHCVFMQ